MTRSKAGQRQISPRRSCQYVQETSFKFDVVLYRSDVRTVMLGRSQAVDHVLVRIDWCDGKLSNRSTSRGTSGAVGQDAGVTRANTVENNGRNANAPQ